MQITTRDIVLALLFNISVGILGIWLIVDPKLWVSFIRIYLGIILIIGSVAVFYMYFKSQEKTVTQLFQAILLGVLGIIFLISSTVTAVFLGIILMVWVFIDAALNIRLSLTYRKFSYNSWWIFLIYGIAAAILGIYLLMNLSISGHALVMIVGIFTLARSIVAIIDTLVFKKRYNEAISKK